MTKDLARRLAVIVALVQASQNKTLGRTALMKLLYFMTVLRGVRLGYHFTLYSYGPFDSEVLQDLNYATSLDALKSHVVGYPTGYGYEIEPGPMADDTRDFDKAFVAAHLADIDWVVAQFGSRTASELELASTIVYVNRQGVKASVDELAMSVNEVKPHFPVAKIREQIKEMSKGGLLNGMA